MKDVKVVLLPSFLPALLGVLALATLPLPARADVYLNQRDNLIYFGNDTVELVLDSASGYFERIRNKQAGIEHKPATEGVWPFGLWAGTRQKPEQMRAEIRSDGVQRMTYKLEEAGGLKRLLLTYPTLLDNSTLKPTGVGLGVSIELAPDRSYFVIRAEIANGGPLWVTSFYAGKGKLLTGDPSPEKERVFIAEPGGFERSKFQGMSLGLPTYSWGWTDYSGQRGGLGQAYVNKAGIQLVFDIQPLGDGLLESWRLFDARGYWHFERLMTEEEKARLIYPLEPGNNFQTGEWLIVPHAGDWHRTADAYRERYVEVFRGDYMDWDGLPDKVKKQHFRLGIFVADNWIGNLFPRQVINPLDSIPAQIETVLQATGVSAERTSLNVIFFHPHVGRYPEFFPVYEPAGGESGWKRMMARLRQMRLGYVIGYTHLSYNHPAARNYVLEADALNETLMLDPILGHRACVDNSAWERLWREELIPAYKAHGLDGVFADEGHFPWGNCTVAGPTHLHGTSAVGILTSNTRGILRLHKLLHEGLGPGSVIDVEGAGDVSGRWADASHAYPHPALAYTLPFKRFFLFVDVQQPEPAVLRKVNEALAHGYVLMFNLRHDQLLRNIGPLRRYVELRRKLEESHAPGYPQGFRDTVGLETSSPELVAKAFADPGGVTLVYYATAPVSGEITVDGAALGHPKPGRRKYRVKLGADELGFQILRAGDRSGQDAF